MFVYWLFAQRSTWPQHFLSNKFLWRHHVWLATDWRNIMEIIWHFHEILIAVPITTFLCVALLLRLNRCIHEPPVGGKQNKKSKWYFKSKISFFLAFYATFCMLCNWHHLVVMKWCHDWVKYAAANHENPSFDFSVQSWSTFQRCCRNFEKS